MLGQVGHPEPVGFRGRKVPLDAVRKERATRIPPRHSPVSPAVDAHEPSGSHEPGHPLPAAAQTVAEGHLGMDPWRSVGFPAGLVDLADAQRQLRIALGVRRGGPAPPRVKPAGGDAQQAAHRYQ